MVKRMIIQFGLGFFCIIMSQGAFAGNLFNVLTTGTPGNVNITLCLNGQAALSCQNYNVSALNLSISTFAPNHTYPAAGIKVNTPGYSLERLGLNCASTSNGYCLFSVSNTRPAALFISQSSGYSIGGTISNLTASGLVLQNNGTDNLSVDESASSFQFSETVPFGGNYNVTVQQQPTGLTCTVSNGSGSHVRADVTGITVTCSVDTYTIGGSISDLTASGLVLLNNGADPLSVSANASSFEFPTPVAYGSSYNVTVQQQPTGLVCVVNNGVGNNVTENISNIAIVCESVTIVGSWKVAPEPGSLAVGPSRGSSAWWTCDNTCIQTRSCFFDDEYVFNANGSFQNVFQGSTWIEGWQSGGLPAQCGPPVPPHNGVNPATYLYNAQQGEITLNGVGAYLGIPKVVNAGELPNVSVPASIKYFIRLESNRMTLDIQAGSSIWWRFILTK